MLRSKKSRLVISLIAACLLWVYEVGEVDPTISETYHSIPIKYSNEQSLNDRKLAVTARMNKKMSVTLKGRRSVIEDIKSGDLKAKVELSDATEGKNSLKIKLDIPGSVTVARKSDSRATVKVEKQRAAQKKINVSYLGEYKSGEEPTTLSIDPEAVSVIGARSIVNKVAYVRATVRKEDIEEGKHVTKSSLLAVDSDGRKVDCIRLSQDEANVKSVLYNTKTVNLEVPVIDHSTDGITRTTDATKSITVKGSAKKLKKVTKILTDPVDITYIYRDTTIDLEPILPNGVLTANESENLILKVSIETTQESKQFSFSGDEITLNGLSKDLEAKVGAKRIEVTVVGTNSQLKKIKKKDLTLSVNLAKLEEGTHSVPLATACSKKCRNIRPSIAYVNIKLQKKNGRTE